MRQKSYQALNGLRERRKDLGLSQQAVARALGLKDNTLISRWESGASLPSLPSAFRLSKIYRTPVDDLFRNLLSIIGPEA